MQRLLLEPLRLIAEQCTRLAAQQLCNLTYSAHRFSFVVTEVSISRFCHADLPAETNDFV
jgi:hypothetical protein